jgi:hypothetical protein
MSIPESDWRAFEQLRVVALERLCERILSAIGDVTADSTCTFHERYLAVYRLIKDGDRDIAESFNDLRRSTALLRLAGMTSLGLITRDEMRSFSDETRLLLEQPAKPRQL